jgi:ElaB/YqjD/DUF883 family membrane-anchored ribosome-binding protein
MSVAVEELFDGVDDLIKRVADTENPEIRKIRAKVHATLVVARTAFEDSANQARRDSAQIADDSDDYLDEYPGQALGVALLVGLGLALLVPLRQ